MQHARDVQHNIQQTRHRRGGTAGVYVEIDWPPQFALVDVEEVGFSIVFTVVQLSDC